MEFSGGGGGMAPGSIMIGGKVLAPGGLKILNFEFEGGVGSGTTAKIFDPLIGDAPADYVVPVGKAFVMHALRYEQFSASAAGSIPFYPGYGDTAVLNASVTNPVGAVSGTASGSRRDMVVGAQLTVSDAVKEVAFFGRVPAGKYPTVIAQTAGSVTGIVQIYGYEVDA